MNSIIEASNISRSYGQLKVVDNVSLAVAAGEFVAVQGPSGSGKSTLLGLIAGLDRPDAGSVVVAGTEITTMGEDAQALFRRHNIGFVFQSFNLIPTLNVVENVAFPLFPEHLKKGIMLDRARKTAGDVGLGERLKHYPSELSGGEQQRVAVARALINAPKVILADEPTGNLDSETGVKIIELLRQVNKEKGLTFILVTHDDKIAAQSDRVIRMKDGRIIS
jgi:putative ABC transport system ATP-binding protein